MDCANATCGSLQFASRTMRDSVALGNAVVMAGMMKAKMPNVSRIEAAIPRSSECSAPSASNSRQAHSPKIIDATMNGQANNPSCRRTPPAR